MENLTHSLTGFFLSHAGLNRFTPRATALLVLAANAPDIDILAIAGGGLNYFHYHRHITHAIVFAPVLAALLVVLFRLVFREPFPFLPAFFVALAGVASHLLLDLTNDYGIRLFLPFSARWFAWDLCSVYDPWIWTFFGFSIAAPFIGRLVGGEIGEARKRIHPSRLFPLAALLFFMLYDGARAVLHQRAVAILDSREYDGAAALRVAALPRPSNPFQWQGVAETPTSYRLYDLDLLSTFTPARFQPVFKATPVLPFEIAARTAPFRILLDFSRFPVWRVNPNPESGPEVTLSDLRYPFECRATFNRAGALKSSVFHFARQQPAR